MIIKKINKKWIVGLIIIAPVLFLSWQIFTKTINVPFWDEWEIVPTIAHLRDGHFIFSDFWVQHNEHRIFFPQLLMVGSAIITHWNLRAESFISILIAATSFFILYKIFIDQKMHKFDKSKYGIILIMSLVWFSLVQEENWIWGWQIEWFLNVFGIMLVIYSLSRIDTKNFSKINFVLLLTGSVIAQFSLASGILIWPIALFSIILNKIDPKKILIYMISGAISVSLYFYHYVSPANPKSSVINNFVPYLHYVFSYFGRPLTFSFKYAPFLGFINILIFMYIAFNSFVKHRDRFIKILPWISMGAYAIGTGVITGYGRLGFGVEESMSSRYTTISSLLLISNIILIWINRDILSKYLNRYLDFFNLSFALLVTFLVIANCVNGVNNLNKQSFYLHEIQTCTNSANPTRICLLSAYPNEKTVKTRIAYLKKIHWGGY